MTARKSSTTSWFLDRSGLLKALHTTIRSTPAKTRSISLRRPSLGWRAVLPPQLPKIPAQTRRLPRSGAGHGSQRSLRRTTRLPILNQHRNRKPPGGVVDELPGHDPTPTTAVLISMLSSRSNSMGLTRTANSSTRHLQLVRGDGVVRLDTPSQRHSPKRSYLRWSFHRSLCCRWPRG